MDEAAVFTIHGFCQRMLRQNAFESGAPLKPGILTDDSRLRLQAVSDHWRAEFSSGGSAPGPGGAKTLAEPRRPAAGDGSWLDNDELEIRPVAGTRPWRRGTASPWPASGR